MFKSDLKSRLEKIFLMRKVTFHEPGASMEQDTMFIEVTYSRNRIHKGWATSKVEGHLTIFTKANAMPYGFFEKRVEQASHQLTKPFFFYEMDTDVAGSPSRMIDIHERRASFVFFFKQQYDPEQGELEKLELSE